MRTAGHLACPRFPLSDLHLPLHLHLQAKKVVVSAPKAKAAAPAKKAAPKASPSSAKASAPK